MIDEKMDRNKLFLTIFNFKNFHQFGCFLNWNACTSKFTGGVSLTRDVDFFGIRMGDLRFGVAGIGRWTRHLQNLRKRNFRRKSFFFFFLAVILKNLDAFEQTHHWSRYLGSVDFRRRWILETFRLFGGAESKTPFKTESMIVSPKQRHSRPL